MSRDTFERLRLPLGLGLGLMLLAGYLVLQRVEADSTPATASPSIVIGAPAGGVLTPTPTPTPAPAAATPSPTILATPPPVPPTPSVAPSAPSPTLVPTPDPTVVPTLAPEQAFVARVLACESISGSECNGEIDRLRQRDDTLVALVLFDNAQAGDVMNAILDGPSGAREGGAYALQGSGRGWYHSTIPVSDLPPGDYTLTALRNGEVVARTELRKTGGGRGGDDDDDD